MYCRVVLLLLTSIATSQTACDRANIALLSNEACYNAFRDVAVAVRDDDATINLEDLNAYCTPECRGLLSAVTAVCGDDPGSTPIGAINSFICTTDGDVSCYDFITSSPFSNFSDAVRASGDCEDDITAREMCSPGCQAAFQNYIIDGGCCVSESLEFAARLAGESLDELLAYCPVDLSRGGTCTEIGGANGLKAFGSVVLFAVFIAVTAL